MNLVARSCRRHLAIVLAGLLCGCAHQELAARQSQAQEIASRHGFSMEDVPTGTYTIRTWKGPKTGSHVLHAYIEGDGFAWVSRNQPSRDPTPNDPLALRLAVQDRAANTVYLGRPCQFVMQAGGCNVRDWTSHRFSEAMVNAMDVALTHVKLESGAKEIVLIGYSGGGAMASLLAARRGDVVHLVTVAGNLDHRAWSAAHQISALSGSLNPPDFAEKLAGVRQTHMIGAKDRVVPEQVYNAYRRVFQTDAEIVLKTIPDADHHCCWEADWPRLLSELD